VLFVAQRTVWTGCKGVFVVVVLLRAAGVIVAPARCGSCRLRSVCTQLAQLLDSSDKRKKVQYSKIIVPIADDL
jgi:hypothetical protein